MSSELYIFMEFNNHGVSLRGWIELVQSDQLWSLHVTITCWSGWWGFSSSRAAWHPGRTRDLTHAWIYSLMGLSYKVLQAEEREWKVPRWDRARCSGNSRKEGTAGAQGVRGVGKVTPERRLAVRMGRGWDFILSVMWKLWAVCVCVCVCVCRGTV